MYGSHLLMKYSNTQSTVALSSGEAELYDPASGCSEGLGLTAMATDYGEEKPPILHVDASAALGKAQRNGLGRVRRIDTQTLWVQDAVRERQVDLRTVDGSKNPADLMTKAFGKAPMEQLLGVCAWSRLMAGRSRRLCWRTMMVWQLGRVEHVAPKMWTACGTRTAMASARIGPVMVTEVAKECMGWIVPDAQRQRHDRTAMLWLES